MDNSILIDKYKAELSILLNEMHNEGISDETIGYILQESINNFNLIEYCRKWFEEIVE